MHVPFVDLVSEHRALAGAIELALDEVFARGDFILGGALERFEAEFAGYIGVRHAVGVGSGLAALELALRAHDIGSGDEVITAANTFIATVFAILATGARPVLVDVNPATYTIDPGALNAMISSRTRAIIPVHLYGHPADLDAVMAIARRHNLVVIEDAAQAHGAKYKGARVGTFGHASAFSFYPSKNLGAYGDGGLVATDDDRVAEKVRLLRNCGEATKYCHAVVGTNSRLDTIQAAVLRVKLPYLDGWNEARRRHAAVYCRAIAPPARTPSASPDVEHVYHVFVVETERRDAVRLALHEREIDTGVHYPVPVHVQPALASLGYRAGDFPVVEAAAARILSLPMYPGLTAAQIAHVVAAVDTALTTTT